MFDTTIHLGDVAVTTAVTLLGIGLRQSYSVVKQFIDKFEEVTDTQEVHAEVLDMHSQILIKNKLTEGRPMPKVAQRRRFNDILGEL